MSDTAVVLGGGLAGMAAANTVMENGGKIVLLDKSAFCGGNSTKATSGINGAATKTQRALGIEDSVELFSSDCLKGGAKKPELVKVLANNSGPDCDWLMDVFGLDLSLVARLGGHSAPRTHRGKERFPGMTITYALIQMVEKIAEQGDWAKVITKAKATSLIFEGGVVRGVNYEKNGQMMKQMGPVIIATGGFGADFSDNSLLAKYRPDLMHLPTSNGEHCTGDGIKMGEAIGARTIDLEWVQVHPTGLVNPKDPDAKVKFLAAEALRGVGGLIFDANGKRFANELGRRDYVTGEMWKNKGPFRLCLNKAASEEIIWHCKHYTGRGVMKYCANGRELAAEIGCSVETMAAEVEKHAIAAKKMEADPEGGPYPAYPSGKCWDEASGKTGSGKKFYHSVINGSQFADEPYYVAIITPIIHYCMGGLEITTSSEVVGSNGRPIPGLYCAGECMGGVHGNNRLGGNSLLDCVVYGRVAGKACAKYMLKGGVKPTSLRALSGEKVTKDRAIVLGGGLSGVAAANTIIENGGKIILLDKSAFCGGNSTKATSGINGANTKSQRALGIQDSVELFSSDCLKGGAKKPELVKVLANNSGPDCDWLMDVFGLDLSLVARLGGHSAPRTHRGKERFPGMTITYALIQMVEKIAESGDLAQVVTKAKATSLIQENGVVIGVNYEKGGNNHRQYGPVVIATGGFGADFSNTSLLAKYRPDLMHLPTSNGEHCTGDGIKMGEAIGAKTIDLEWVQVHPTGLVNPSDPDAKVKFLAAEALRGVGGLVFDANGKRFANELGRRDYVTGEMWKNKAPFRLCLNKAASDEIIWHCKHYTGRGVMKYYESGAALAKDMGVSLSVMEEEVEKHAIAAKKMEADPEGGPFPAYPSGKCWDEASGKTGSGKKFYHNVINGSQFATEPYYVAIITPIIHYCMGGLEITPKAEVVGPNNQPIPGLWCAGEVMGGVHGNNRLGGNSLLDCVVYGRVAGQSCVNYMLDGKLRKVDLKAVSGGGVQGGGTQKSALSGGAYEESMNAGGAAKPAAAGAAVAAAAGVKGYTLADVAKHNTEKDCWVVVNGQVLDVTKFLPDHPGGALAIVTFAGKDASEEFNMIHPPDVIGKYAPDAVIGPLVKEGEQIAAAPVAGGAPAAAAASGGPKHASLDQEEKKGASLNIFGVLFLTPIALLALPLAGVCHAMCSK